MGTGGRPENSGPSGIPPVNASGQARGTFSKRKEEERGRIFGGNWGGNWDGSIFPSLSPEVYKK